jgi:hypothetical protein
MLLENAVQRECCPARSSSKSFAAARRSRVWKPSEKRLKIVSSKSRARLISPRWAQSLARLIPLRSSRESRSRSFASCSAEPLNSCLALESPPAPQARTNIVHRIQDGSFASIHRGPIPALFDRRWPMTMFSSIASHGQRWKMFLPGAAADQCYVLRVSTAAALIRSHWLSDGAAGCHRRRSLALGALACARCVKE